MRLPNNKTIIIGFNFNYLCEKEDFITIFMRL